jgi:hypothetical protein
MNDSHDPGGAKRTAGVVIDTDAGLWFVPTEHALAALDDPRLSDVPGTQLQMLWFEGRVVPAVSWAVLRGADTAPAPTERRSAQSRRALSALVCELGGQTLALIGVLPVASGLFEECPEGVRFGGESVPRADLAALYRQAQALRPSRNESRDDEGQSER